MCLSHAFILPAIAAGVFPTQEQEIPGPVRLAGSVRSVIRHAVAATHSDNTHTLEPLPHDRPQPDLLLLSLIN